MRAAEVVRKETKSMQDTIAKRESENFSSDGEINAVYRNTPCYRYYYYYQFSWR